MKLARSELQLETIVSRIVADELDLQPDFQRGEIWDRRRRQRLIDTILRRWYVPAVHIVQHEDGTEVVLDGQQRLAAIRDFFDDVFTVDGRTEPYSEHISSLHGLKFSGLPEADQRAVRRFILQVITLTDFRPQEPNELFFRLNQSYNLTPPEKRNALHGPARDRVRSLVDGLASDGLLKREVVGFANGRLAYDDIVARTCVALERNMLTAHINNNVVEEFYRNADFDDETIDRVREAGRGLLRQIEAGAERVRFNKGSLFTWLIYLDWAPRVTEVPPGLLGEFELDRVAAKAGGEGIDTHRSRVLECVALYEDRASYRVTDVSSVVLRDLALHVYSCLKLGTAPVGGARSLLDEMSRRPGTPISGLMAEFVEVVGWGEDLLRPGS